MCLKRSTYFYFGLKTVKKPNQFAWGLGQNTEVIASNVHFNHFRNWHELINVNLSGKATSTDVDTDMKFVSKFQELVKAGIYNNHQPFNVDETSLF